jgi:hypothetical protein
MGYIVSWIDIALGVMTGAAGLIKLTAAWSKPGMTKHGARSDAWFYIFFALSIIAGGISALGEEAKNDTADHAGQWSAVVFAALALLFLIRSRMRRKRDGATTEG